MTKAIFWITVSAGAVAAYLMLRRGAPLGEIAHDAVEHPFKSLASELQAT
jgi:hypothetical protein